MSPTAAADEALPFEPLLLPPLFRSEGFAEDLGDVLDMPAAPAACHPAALRRVGAALLWTAPMAVVLIGAAASVLV